MSSPRTAKISRKTAAPQESSVAANVFSGGGEMGALMRALDWSKTPIGPVSNWPQSLKTAVRIILTSRYAMFVWWGRELVNLYNDPYRAFLGTKHPAALGKSAREVWAEIWDQIGPRTDAVLLRGESTYDEALLLMMERHGYMEETYFTFSYSPLPDEKGNVGGLFCAVTEETQQVIGERRLRLLREIASAMAGTRTPAEVCESAARSLATARRDLPFSLIYLFDNDGKTLRRAALAGVDAHHPAAPELANLDGDAVWPFRRVIETGEPVLIEDLDQRFTNVPTGDWNQPPKCAVLLPISQQGNPRPAGVFVAGLNPYRRFDDEFRGFVSLLSNQIAAAIATAVAYETERDRAETLAKIDRAKTLFFSNVSHEFRTPLTLMLGPLEQVLSNARERLAHEDQDHLAAARRNALRLLKLVNTLLDFSRIEAGRVEAVYEPTDLASLTAEIASVFRSAMEKAGLRFTVDCEHLSEPVYVDHDMWEKIVLNLLSNAFKYTFEGEVMLALKPVDGHVELSVKDTGVGIPEHELSRVFERFHRIENTRGRTHEGTGIGLALVQELAKLHGGSVRVKSELGQGSTFTVSVLRGTAHLPADRIQARRTVLSTMVSADTYVDEAQRWLPQGAGGVVGEPVIPKLPSLATPERPVARERAAIVLADDNADMRAYVSHLLSGEYRVHAVSDGAQAIEAARQLRPALILADVMMPRLDGFGMLQAIRGDTELSGIPVILLSARAGEESRVEGLEAGADDYLVKPFTARELLARVGTHIKMANLRREAAEREARLRAEAERERHRLQELLEQAPAAIGLMTGPEHRWVYVNEQYVRVTGRSGISDFVGRTIKESLPEIEKQPFVDLLDEVYRTGKPHVGREAKAFLSRAHTGQSNEAYFDFVYQPVTNAEQEVEGILVHAVEVTDRVMARKAIEESEARLRAIVGTTPECVKLVAADGTLLQMNSAGLAMIGADSEQMAVGKNIYEVIAPEDRDRYREFNERICRGERGSLEFDIIGLKGLRRHMETHAAPLRNPDGSTLHLAVTRDVTQRKNSEQARRESEQRLRIVTDASPIMVWMSGTDKLCYYFNKTWLDFVGRTLEQEAGNGWAENVHPEDFDRCLQIYVSSFDARRPFQMEYRLRHHSGQYRWILDRGVPRYAPDGTFEGYVGGCLDIHDQKDAAEKVRMAAEALRESEERYRTVAETASDAIISIDVNSTILFANSATADVFGYSPEELIGKNLTLLMPDYMRRFHEEGVQRYLNTGQRHLNWDATELPGLHKDGHQIPLEVSFGEYTRAGERYFTGFARDITERKRAEQALREREREFRGLADSVPALVWMANPDGWIYWYNHRWYEYTGTTPEQMEGWGWQSVHDPSVLPQVLERWKSSIATGQPFEMTFPLRGADGVFRPFLTRVVPVRDDEGKVARWFGTNTDVSVEVNVQEELRRSQDRLRSALLNSQKLAAIVEFSDDAIISKDLRGIVTSWNPAAETIFGYTAEEMIGRSITTIIPPELRPDEDRILRTIARGERIDHFETVRVRKDGEQIDVSLTISPLKDETGKIIGAAKVARDITQRKKAERALHTSERLASVGRLAATVAHEINNPLEAVTNLIYLAKEDAAKPDVRAHLAAAEEELERISHLTKQTLGFYRETKGARPMRLGTTINPLISVFGSKMRNKSVEIYPEIKDDPEIYAVPGEIRQLMANLLSNSIDAVSAGGRIRIRIAAATEWNGTKRLGVRLTVADSGVGIAPAERSRLFEPFFTTKKEVGTGLGLWVCKSIVEKHQGSIRVKSSAIPGRSWTAFSVFLPAPAQRSTSGDPLRKAV